MEVNKMAKLTTAEMIEAIKELSVVELNDLVKACEEEFGVSAAAGVVVAAAGAGEGAAAEEEKDSFDVELTAIGESKVKVIKVVREITGLGLKEAKDLDNLNLVRSNFCKLYVEFCLLFFNCACTEVGPNKVKVIKVVREITGLGLKEAKDLVDASPKMVKEGANKAEAEEIKTKLEEAGATCTLK